MKYRDIGDVLVPLVTPFKEDESLDYDRLAKTADWILDTGRGDSLIVTGTTGEFAALTDKERIQSWGVVMDACGDRAPIIAGSGAASTRSTITLTQEAERIGMDMAMIVGPYYQKPTDEGVFRHYVEVAENTSLPIIVYNIPLFTGVNVSADIVRRLMDIPNIVAVKEEAGINPAQSTKLLLNARAREDFVVLDGDDMMALPIIAQGASGIVSGGAQVIGVAMKKCVAALKADDLVTARDIFMDLFPVFEAFGGKGRTNPIPGVRAGMALCGMDTGNCRRPLTPFDAEETEALRNELVRVGAVS